MARSLEMLRGAPMSDELLGRWQETRRSFVRWYR